MIDADLLDRAKGKDRDALKQIFNTYSRKVFGTSYLILKNREYAEDAVQETFVQVCIKINSVRDAFTFEGWLYRITVNCCIKLMKKISKHRTISIDDTCCDLNLSLPNIEETPEKTILISEDKNELAHFVYKLPPYQRIPIILYYYNEMPIREIAEVMECSQNTIKSRLSQGKNSLKKLITDSNVGEIGGISFGD